MSWLQQTRQIPPLTGGLAGKNKKERKRGRLSLHEEPSLLIGEKKRKKSNSSPITHHSSISHSLNMRRKERKRKKTKIKRKRSRSIVHLHKNFRRSPLHFLQTPSPPSSSPFNTHFYRPPSIHDSHRKLSYSPLTNGVHTSHATLRRLHTKSVAHPPKPSSILPQHSSVLLSPIIAVSSIQDTPPFPP